MCPIHKRTLTLDRCVIWSSSEIQLHCLAKDLCLSPKQEVEYVVYIHLYSPFYMTCWRIQSCLCYSTIMEVQRRKLLFSYLLTGQWQFPEQLWNSIQLLLLSVPYYSSCCSLYCLCSDFVLVHFFSDLWPQINVWKLATESPCLNMFLCHHQVK